MHCGKEKTTITNTLPIILTSNENSPILSGKPALALSCGLINQKLKKGKNMFYKKYLEKLIARTYKENRLKIEELKKIIDDNDDNARQHWENQKNLTNEIIAKQNMLVDAFNEQRIIIAKLVAKMNKKAVKTTKKGK